MIPTRPFGRHADVSVSALGLGGYHLGSVKSVRESTRIVHAAIDAGVTFLDNAWEYHEHESEIRMGRAIADRRDRVFLMTKVCTHGRDGKVAMRQLEDSLKRLKTDHLDLWQVHECVYYTDPDLHFARGGVVEALDRAKREGKVRFVGFTGHKDPDIHLRMLKHEYPFDSCQMPLNVFDASFKSFEQRVLPEVLRQRIAPIGMKPFCGHGDAIKKRVVSAEDALSYAMSLPVVTTISGIDSMKVLKQNVAIADRLEPLSRAQMERIRHKVAAFAEHDGDEGRGQHGFPLQDELAS
jgi:aryl-alcohol dehydrogenase-like predicted oxidoreductase